MIDLGFEEDIRTILTYFKVCWNEFYLINLNLKRMCVLTCDNGINENLISAYCTINSKASALIHSSLWKGDEMLNLM